VVGLNLICLTATVACRETLDPRVTAAGGPPARVVTVTDTVLPSRDTYISKTLLNKNFGSSDTLRTGGPNRNRALLAFDSAAIAQAVGTGQLDSAWLELTIVLTDGLGASGRTFDLHRLLSTWTELGATWNCPVDANTANDSPDCTGSSWDMTNGNAYASSYTARVTVVDQQTGVLRLNVTSDVASFLNGTANYGWIFRKTNESLSGGTVTFSRNNPATGPRLVLSVTRNLVPGQAPDSIPAWVYSDTNIASSGTTAIDAPFTKRIVIVEFKQGASAFQRDSAISVVGGTVVGGSTVPGQEGHYYVRLEDTVGTALLAAASQLRAMPQVASAFANVAGAPNWVLPTDGAHWQTSTDWAITPATLTDTLWTWALTMINAPLAWGCSVGSASTQVAVVDLDFLTTLPDLSGMSLSTGPSPVNSHLHGAGVSALLAARGNDGNGMTGVMWNADVRLYDLGQYPAQGVSYAEAAGRELVHAGLAGARVINISLGTNLHSKPQGLGTAAQRAARDEWYQSLRGAMQVLADSLRRPLVVVAAGNDGVDASWNGSPLIRDNFPSQVIVVGAVTSEKDLWDSSDTGAYVDVLAPGERVYTYGTSGTISNTRDGTSLSAPLVSGIAGLLFSFDPRLTADLVKQMIVTGAHRANNTVTESNVIYYIADAYEALKMAAERTTAPVCGNKMWTVYDSVFVERGSPTNVEKIFVRPDGHGAPLAPYHGGHYLDFFGPIMWQNGVWVNGPPVPPTTLSGTYYSARATSHDGTRQVSTQIISGPPNNSFGLFDQGVNVHTFSGSAANNLAYSPIRDEVLIPILPNGGTSIDLHRFKLTSGQDTVLFQLPYPSAYGMVISEDGKEVMFGTPDFLANTCSMQVRSLVTGLPLQLDVQLPYLACGQPTWKPSAVRAKP